MIDQEIILRDGTSHGRIINGCWQFSQGHSTDTEAPTHVLQEYINAGYRVFDGADIYTGVEEVFGNTRMKNKDIPNLRFHTKHVPDLDDVLSGNISQEKTISQIMRSCERMQTSMIDNVQFHWWDYGKSGYEISLSTLIDLQSKGIIKHIGVTNCSVDFLKKLERELGFIPMTSQNQYSIIDRRIERHLMSHAGEKQIGLYVYGSLMGGLLSNRYLGANKPHEPLENRSLRKYLRVIEDWGNWELFQELLSTLDIIGEKYNVSISQISITWVLHRDAISSAIVGVRNTKHIDSLQKIVSIALGEEDIDMIDSIYNKGIPLTGDVFDLERYEPRHRDIMKYNLNKDEN